MPEAHPKSGYVRAQGLNRRPYCLCMAEITFSEQHIPSNGPTMSLTDVDTAEPQP